MGVMHPTGVYYGKDDVIWLWRVAYWEFGKNCVHHGLRWLLYFSCIYASCLPATLDLARSPEYHLNSSSFMYMVGVSPSFGVFCLYGLALFATGLVSTCSLVTTLDISVYSKIAIRPEFVRYALVAYRVKCVYPLETTLNIVVRYNIAIKLCLSAMC